MGKKSERLEEIRQELGLNKSAFAQLMGIEPRYYSHISTENGKGNLRTEHLEALFKNANVNPLWVLTGEGDRYVRISTEFVAADEPTEDQVNALYDLVVIQEGADFDKSIIYLTKFICAQVISEFPDAETLEQLSFAARAYIRVVKRMPATDFMDILGVRNPLGEGENKQTFLEKD